MQNQANLCWNETLVFEMFSYHSHKKMKRKGRRIKRERGMETGKKGKRRGRLMEGRKVELKGNAIEGVG